MSKIVLITGAAGSIGIDESSGTGATTVADYNAYYGFESPNSVIDLGANDITTDPQLNPDYTLATTSPCLGTGDTSVLPLTDYTGRTFGNPTNMGAYALPQLANNLLATNTGNTADDQNYDGVWTSQAWETIPDNTRYYPMNEGQ